jgi:hypothetical protein
LRLPGAPARKASVSFQRRGTSLAFVRWPSTETNAKKPNDFYGVSDLL